MYKSWSSSFCVGESQKGKTVLLYHRYDVDSSDRGADIKNMNFPTWLVLIFL
jgi:hypothetical protein